MLIAKLEAQQNHQEARLSVEEKDVLTRDLTLMARYLGTISLGQGAFTWVKFTKPKVIWARPVTIANKPGRYFSRQACLIWLQRYRI